MAILPTGEIATLNIMIGSLITAGMNLFGGATGGGDEAGGAAGAPGESTTQTATSSGTFDTGEVSFVRGTGGGIDKTTLAIGGVVLLVIILLLRGK